MYVNIENPQDVSIVELTKLHEMSNPVVYERISYYNAYKKVLYSKKSDKIKISKLKISENDYILVDEVFRTGWNIFDFEIYQPHRFGKFNLDTKIIVNNPEGFNVFVNAECVVELLAKSEHNNGSFINKMRLDPDSNCLELEEDLSDESE